MKDRILYYKKQQYVIGLYGLLIVLEFFEKYEDYNECYSIVEAIKLNNIALNMNMTTHIKNTDFKQLDKNKQSTYSSEAKKVVLHVIEMNKNAK